MSESPPTLQDLMALAKEAGNTARLASSTEEKVAGYELAADLFDQAAAVATDSLNRSYIVAAAAHHRAAASQYLAAAAQDQFAGKYLPLPTPVSGQADTASSRGGLVLLLVLVGLIAVGTAAVVLLLL